MAKQSEDQSRGPETLLAEQIEDAVDGGDWPTKKLRPVIEAVLFAAADPVPTTKLAEIIEGATRMELSSALSELEEDLCDRGFRLLQVAGGWQLRTAPEHQSIVRKMFKERPFRLTRAALETLAIVAYRQPITRAEVEAVRGVDCSAVLESLVERKLIRVAGRRDVPGRPLVYASTPTFLEMFGLKDLKALPTLGELGDEFTTMAEQAGFDAAENADAAVLPLEDEDGEEHALARQDHEGADREEDGGQAARGDASEERAQATHEGHRRGAGQGDDGVPKIRFRKAGREEEDPDDPGEEGDEDPPRPRD